MSNKLSVKDALILQEEEDIRLINGRTRRAIQDTYGKKSPTKKRRKLPGKRNWKNKSIAYQKLNMQMDSEQFRAYEKAQKVIEKHNAKKQKAQIKKMARSAKKHPLHD